MRSWFLCRVLLTASTLLLVPSTYAQNGTSPAAAQPPAFQVQAHAVLIDVVVAKGKQPALHLQQQDFRVFDNGTPETIDFFQENAAPPVATTPATPPMPPQEFTNQPATQPGDQVTVLLLDRLNTHAADQAAFIDGVRAFVRGLRPGTPIAVFTLSSQLRLVQGFTGDPAKLQASMSGKGAPVAGTTAIAHTAQDDAMDQMQAASLAESLGMRDNSVAPMNQLRANERSTLTLQALNALSRYLAGIPGRKNLIWYASDFPLAIFPDDRIGQTLAQNQAFGSEVRTTTGLLAAARVAVYPVSAAGISNDSWTQASNTAENSSIDGMTQQSARDQNARAANIAAMEQIATDTGGRAMYSTNDLGKAAADAMQNGAHYYTLAYTPSTLQPDGSYHRIEVKLTGHNEKLEYRRGYFADSGAAPTASADPLISLLRDGLPSATQIIYRVRALPALPQPVAGAPVSGGNRNLSGPRTRYLVDLTVPTDGLDLASRPDGSRSGNIELALVAYDPSGKAVNWTGGATAIDLTPASFAAAQKSGIPLRLQLDLPDEPLRLATGVYDLRSSKVGTLEIPFDAKAHP